MTEKQTLDEYLIKQVNKWKSSSEIDEIPYLDLRAGAIYMHQGNEFQCIKSTNFEIYLDAIKKVMSLKKSEREISPDDCIKALEGFLDLEYQPREAYGITIGHDQTKHNSHISRDSTKVTNAKIIDNLLDDAFGFGGYHIKIIGNQENYLPEFHKMLGKNTEFNKKYKISNISEKNIDDRLWGKYLLKSFSLKPSQKEYSNDDPFLTSSSDSPNNQISIHWPRQGSVMLDGPATPHAELALDLTEVLKENKIPAVYDFIPRTRGSPSTSRLCILEGAIYDPDWKREIK